jgi:hypothetical protein
MHDGIGAIGGDGAHVRRVLLSIPDVPRAGEAAEARLAELLQLR